MVASQEEINEWKNFLSKLTDREIRGLDRLHNHAWRRAALDRQDDVGGPENIKYLFSKAKENKGVDELIDVIPEEENKFHLVFKQSKKYSIDVIVARRKAGERYRNGNIYIISTYKNDLKKKRHINKYKLRHGKVIRK